MSLKKPDFFSSSSLSQCWWYLGSVQSRSPMKRLSASVGELRFCVSPWTMYHSPRKPSLTPPPIGILPPDLSFVHASMKPSQSFGGASGSSPAASKCALL